MGKKDLRRVVDMRNRWALDAFGESVLESHIGFHNHALPFSHFCFRFGLKTT